MAVNHAVLQPVFDQARVLMLTPLGSGTKRYELRGLTWKLGGDAVFAVDVEARGKFQLPFNQFSVARGGGANNPTGHANFVTDGGRGIGLEKVPPSTPATAVETQRAHELVSAFDKFVPGGCLLHADYWLDGDTSATNATSEVVSNAFGVPDADFVIYSNSLSPNPGLVHSTVLRGVQIEMILNQATVAAMLRVDLHSYDGRRITLMRQSLANAVYAFKSSTDYGYATFSQQPGSFSHITARVEMPVAKVAFSAMVSLLLETNFTPPI